MTEQDNGPGHPRTPDDPQREPAAADEAYRPIDRAALSADGDRAASRSDLGFGPTTPAAPTPAAATPGAVPSPDAVPDPPPPPGAGSRWGTGASSEQPPPPSGSTSDAPTSSYGPRPPIAAGVPARPNPLPPPRPARPPGAPVGSVPRSAPQPRPASAPRPVARARTARLTLKRVDPWSVFLYSVVASVFLGIALIVAVGVLYGVLSSLGVLTSVNKLIGDVTAAPGTTATPSNVLSGAKIMTFAALLAAVDVVLLTALSTLAAFLYNLCAALTGGIEVTLSDRDAR